MEPNLKVPTSAYFCDFDGTIAVKDVGDELHKRFSSPDWQTVNQAYREGRISSKQCLAGQYEFFRGRRDQVEEFVLEHEIDPTFPGFVDWTRQRQCPLVVLSDGLDFYIELLLGKYRIENLACFSNRAHFNGDRVRVSFPHHRPDCAYGCQCGNCKPAHMEAYAAYRRVFIGDGLSDRYAARTADVVYAKEHLAAYCREDRLPHVVFRDFADIMRFEQEADLNRAVGR